MTESFDRGNPGDPLYVAANPEADRRQLGLGVHAHSELALVPVAVDGLCSFNGAEAADEAVVGLSLGLDVAAHVRVILPEFITHF